MAITSQSLRSAVTVEDGRQAIEQRLIAFGRAHDLLLQANWKSAQLREILNKAIEPFDNETPSRFVIQSSNIETAASAAVPLAMAINELCTNAAKYGALSRPGACVEITAETDELRSQFCLRWKEKGGPPVRPPTRQGFGTRLIQQSFVNQLNGAVRLSFDPSGVMARPAARDRAFVSRAGQEPLRPARSGGLKMRGEPFHDRDDIRFSVRFRKKFGSRRKRNRTRIEVSRHKDNLDRRPARSDDGGELHSVDAERHVDIQKNNSNIKPRFKNLDCFSGVGRGG
jgi:two-component sensor histidine kinase